MLAARGDLHDRAGKGKVDAAGETADLVGAVSELVHFAVAPGEELVARRRGEVVVAAGRDQPRSLGHRRDRDGHVACACAVGDEHAELARVCAAKGKDLSGVGQEQRVVLAGVGISRHGASPVRRIDRLGADAIVVVAEAELSKVVQAHCKDGRPARDVRVGEDKRVVRPADSLSHAHTQPAKTRRDVCGLEGEQLVALEDAAAELSLLAGSPRVQLSVVARRHQVV